MTTFAHRRFTALLSLLSALLLGVGMLTATAPADATPGQAAPGAERSSSKAAPRRVNFGAIALNVRNQWSGWAIDKKTKKKAKKGAVKHCRKRAKAVGASPKGCKTVLWVRNGCAAIAVRMKKKEIVKVRGAIATTLEEAKAAAKKSVGKKAKVHTYICTTHYA